MNKTDKTYIAAHCGMVGSPILRNLQLSGFTTIVMRISNELDLRDGVAVSEFFRIEQPTYVFLAAAKVSGIIANNTNRSDFFVRKSHDPKQCNPSGSFN